MSLELSSIVFKATTDELDAAVKKIEVLGKSVEGLASSLGKLDKAAAETNKTQAQANLINAKAEKELAKAIDITDKSVAATERLTKATKEKQSVEERQAAITRIMSDGYSRGQASILATAEAMGEATERTAELLKTQRAMQGVSPFDKSLGAATVFANELRVATVASDLYNKDLGFTKNQLQELGREHVRLTEQFKVQGKSLSGLDAEFQKIVQSAQQVTQAENTMAASMKNADKATIDAGKANAYIENELQKVRFALQANNEELNRGTSNSLVRFENALKKSGLTLDQQRVKIDEYRRSQIELQKTQKANQTDYITRAVGPQITDIIVGLSTGQSPLTVMMQQGGQLRDQFGMMGVAAKDMGDVMRNAMKGMASSVFDTGKAITTMLAGGMFDAGKAVVNYASSFLFVDKAMEKMRENIIGMSKDFDTAADNLAKFDRIAGGFGKVVTVGILALITTLAAVGVAAVQNIKLMNELSQTLVSVGASYGLTSSQVLEYSDAISGAGISTQGSIAAMTQMIKAGAGTAESLQSITLAAVQLEKAGGQSVEATSKMYADLAKDPVKALSELRINTGLVTEANMENIMSLVEQGKEIDAVREAGLIMTDALTQSTKLLYNDMSPLQQLWIDMKGSLTDVWNGVNDIATSSGVVIAFRVVWESVALVIKGVFNTIKGLSTAVVAVMHNDWTGAVNILKETFGTVADNYTDATEAVSKTTEAMTSGVKVQTEAVKKAQEQSLAEKERLLTASALKDTKEKDQKLNAKTLSQSEFITKALEDKNKLLGQNNKLEGKNLAMVQRVAKAEWESLQPKEKKAKLSDEQKAENKNLEDYIDLMNKSVGLNKDYNNVLDGLQTRKKNGKITEQEYVKAIEELIKQQKFYTDGLSQEEKQLRLVQKAWEDTNKAQAKKDDDYLKSYDALKAQSSELKNATSEIEFQFGLLGKTEEQQKLITREHKLQNDLREVQAELEKEIQKIREEGQDSSLEIIARENAAEKIKAINAGVALQAAQDMMKEFDAIKSSITDVIVTALFDGGEAGSKKLRDQIVSVFRNKITVVIDAVVNTALTELFSGATGGSTGGAGQAGSGILGTLSTGKSFVDALSGSMNSAIATSFGKFASTSMGQSLGLSTSVGVHGPVTAAGASPTMLTSTGTMLQGAMVSAASIGAGLALNKAISGGYSMGKGMDNFQKVTIVVSELFGKGFGTIAGAISGVVNRAFGRKLTETGIQGTFGGDQGFTGQNYKFEKGGWFRSDKTSTSPIDPALQSGLAQQFNMIKSSVGFMAAMLGQGTDAISSFTASIKLNFKDLSEEESTKLLQKEFDKISESLAGLALGTTQYNRTGETNVETLTRLHTSLLTANSALSVLGGYLFDVSLVGADASQVLIDLMGGEQQFTSTLGNYYQNFYTEEERTATATRNLVSEFAKLNIEMPAINESTREWYRSEVERLGAMDLSVEANARALASVLGLQDAVNQLAPAFDEATTSVEGTIEAQRELLKINQSWTDRLNILKGTETDRSIALRDATDDSTRAIMNQVYTLEDLIQAEKALASERASLMTQLWQLTNQTKKIRESELASIDPSNQPIKLAIYAIEDAKSAFDMLGKSVAKEKENITKAYETEKTQLQTKYDAQIKANELQVKSANDTLSAIQNIANKLKDAIKQVKIESDELSFSRLKQARSLIQSAVGSSNLAGIAGLEDALDTAGQDSQMYYSSFEEYAFEQGKTAGVIAELERTAQGQLSEAERTLLALESQNTLAKELLDKELMDLQLKHEEDLAKLDATLAQGQEQLNVLLGIDSSILSVNASVAALGVAITSAFAAQAAAIAAVGAAQAAAKVVSSGGGGGGGAAVDSGMIKYGADWITDPTNPLYATSQYGKEHGMFAQYFTSFTPENWDSPEAYEGYAGSDFTEAQRKQVGIDMYNIIVNSPGRREGIIQRLEDEAVFKAGGVSYDTSAMNSTIESLYQQVLGRAPDPEGLAYFQNQLGAGGMSVAEMGYALQSSPEFAALQAQKKLDGSHADGLANVPFDGYIAELHQGERVLTQRESIDYSAMNSSSSLMTAEALRALADRLDLIEANTRAAAAFANRTAKILERVTPDGDAVSTRVAT